VAPTILEVAGLPEPVSVDGIQQKPLEGVSMLYTFDDAKAPERHETQYFEMFGNRGIYHKGWTAVTKHRTPWILEEKVPAFDDDVWELYDTNVDWTQAKDLSKTNPKKLHELQRLWIIEATRYKVLPLDDDMMRKLSPDMAGRPTLIKGKTQLLFPGMGRLLENCVVNIKNKSHSVTAEIVVPEKGAEGVIICQGANIGGYAGDGIGKGGHVTLYTDGKKVGEGDIEATLAQVFSADDGLDVGEDSGAPVSPDYGAVGNHFTGTIKGALISIEEAKGEHKIDPAQAVRLAMARQ
jgi:arylsulfatase